MSSEREKIGRFFFPFFSSLLRLCMVTVESRTHKHTHKNWERDPSEETHTNPLDFISLFCCQKDDEHRFILVAKKIISHPAGPCTHTHACTLLPSSDLSLDPSRRKMTPVGSSAEL